MGAVIGIDGTGSFEGMSKKISLQKGLRIALVVVRQ